MLYTQGVIDGTVVTLKDFAMKSASAFFRDGKFPEVVKPDVKWHKDCIKSEQARLKRLLRLTTKGKIAYGQRQRNQMVKQYEDVLIERKEMQKRVSTMLNAVASWKVKKRLQPLKMVMTEQLTRALDFDCDTVVVEGMIQQILEVTPINYYRTAVKMAKSEIKYHKEQIAKEIKSVNETNKWIAELHACLAHD